MIEEMNEKEFVEGLPAEAGEFQVTPESLSAFAQQVLEFSVKVVKVCDVLQHNSGVVRFLSDCLLKSGSSVASYVNEAQSATMTPDALENYAYALTEVKKAAYWTKLLIDSELKNEEPDLLWLLTESEAIASILVRIMTTLMVREPSVKKGKRKKDKGIESELREL